MKIFEGLIRQVLVLALVCLGVVLTLFAIADLPPVATRKPATLSCFTDVPPAPGPEAQISAPPSPLPGRASMAARAHPLKETRP